MKSYDVDSKLIRLLKEINGNAQAAVRIGNEIGAWFDTSRGTRQGDPISPSLFIMHLERALDKIRDEEAGVSISGTRINHLAFADDIDMIEEEEQQLRNALKALIDEGTRYGLTMNFDKTKTMVFGEKEIDQKIIVDGHELENVDHFTYLGCCVTYDLSCKKEIVIRIAKATAALKAMEKIWKSKAINLQTKLSVLNTCIFSCMLYGCEAWVMTKECERRVLAFERKCYRKILRIAWTQKINNEEVYRRIQVKENLMQKIIQRKLRLFGHICRMKDDRKIKTLVFGMMDGKNRRGRPHREWADDITGWCGASLQQLSHTAQDRAKWSSVVHKASDTYGR